MRPAAAAAVMLSGNSREHLRAPRPDPGRSASADRGGGCPAGIVAEPAEDLAGAVQAAVTSSQIRM
jgi:hypothetical protein